MTEAFALLDRIPIGAFAITSGYKVLFWNLCMEGWTEFAARDAVGKDLRELFPRFRDGAIARRLETVFAGGPPVVFSYQLHGDLISTSRAKLVPRIRQCTASALPRGASFPDAGGGALFAVEDRTDVAAKAREARTELARRERVERDLRRASAEKDMLMRELNHRVKNNLHMVQSLIMLERSEMPEGGWKDRLADLEARINSIAALHESLYKLQAGSEIRADEYLASVCEHLLSVYGSDEGPPRLELELDLEAITLPADQILYLGLAVNELVTNAVKHGGRKVRLGLARVPGEGVEATVQDDGPGFSGPLPIEGDSLGVKLVAMLAEQLGGSMEADGSSGGFFRIAFPFVGRKGESA
jgi:two-component sensor histidine kinase